MSYSLQNPQTLEQFLAKYAGALDSQGRFIPGKANLEYDDMRAEDVYNLMIGGSPLYDSNGAEAGTQPMAAEVNADWIEDPRAKGWLAQHPAGAAIIGTVLGGVGANMAGLLGSGAAGGGASSAFGGGGLGAANAVTAADLALTAMPQAVTGAGTFAGGGTLGAAAGGAAGSALGASAFGGGSPSWMTGANAVGAGDLSLASMPQAVGAGGAFSGGGTMAGLGSAGASALGSTGGGSAAGGFGPGGASGTIGATGGFGPGGASGSIGGGMLGPVGKFLGENPTLAKIGGALLGAAAGQDTTTSSQKDPWAPAQPYLKENLQRNSAMQDFYAKNPFSDQQKSAYQGLLDTLENNRSNAPAMTGIANAFMSSNRGLLGNLPQFTTGTKAPVVDWSKYSNIGLMG